MIDPKKRRQTWIDALKGVAICGVVMIHSGGANLPSYLGKIGYIGKNGVQLFFLLSAFLVFKSYENSFVGKERKYKEQVKWVIRKFIRLIPLYYISLLICGVVQGGNDYWLGSEEGITIENIMAHIVFLHGFFPHYINSMIGVEWYLSALAILYCLTPFLYKIINLPEKSVAWFMVSGIVCELVSSVCSQLVSGCSDSYIYGNYFITLWFVAQFPVMLLGIVLYYVIRGGYWRKYIIKEYYLMRFLYFLYV